MYLLSFYVPETHLESVKQALFAAGAGKFKDYDSCCWQTLGQGQFRPLSGSNPFLGEQDKVEKLPEYKVELICTEENVKQVVNTLKNAHPYEEPAYQVIKLLDI